MATSFIKNAAKRDARLIVCDSRATPMTRLVKWHLAFKPDTNVAMLQAMLHAIVHEGLMDEVFLRERVAGYEALKASVAATSPEAMADVRGIDAATLREVARAFARSKASMILRGMGVSQHVHGSGLHALRGKNHVQGSSNAGLMVVEVMKAIDLGVTQGMDVQGENPAMSEPDLNHARKALVSMQHLVVHDIFPTETAVLADVVLPAGAFFYETGSQRPTC